MLHLQSEKDQLQSHLFTSTPGIGNRITTVYFYCLTLSGVYYSRINNGGGECAAVATALDSG